MIKLRHNTNDVCFLVANSREFIIYDIILLALEKNNSTQVTQLIFHPQLSAMIQRVNGYNVENKQIQTIKLIY